MIIFRCSHCFCAFHAQDLFSFEELQLLLLRENRYAMLDMRNKTVLSLLIHQALTSEDLVRLTVDNIDIDAGTIYIKASHGLHRRLLELHRSQVGLLYNYITSGRPMLIQSSTNRLLLGKLGNPLSVDGIHAITEQFKRTFPGRSINPSTIRQSVIAYWLNVLRIPLEAVQQMAGHKWPSSTEKYLSRSIDKEKVLINKYHPLMAIFKMQE